MSERFKEILEEATKQVSEWPEWKKSEALKRTEQALESDRDKTAQAKKEDSKANSVSAGS